MSESRGSERPTRIVLSIFHWVLNKAAHQDIWALHQTEPQNLWEEASIRVFLQLVPWVILLCSQGWEAPRRPGGRQRWRDERASHSICVHWTFTDLCLSSTFQLAKFYSSLRDQIRSASLGHTLGTDPWAHSQEKTRGYTLCLVVLPWPPRLHCSFQLSPPESSLGQESGDSSLQPPVVQHSMSAQ